MGSEAGLLLGSRAPVVLGGLPLHRVCRWVSHAPCPSWPTPFAFPALPPGMSFESKALRDTGSFLVGGLDCWPPWFGDLIPGSCEKRTRRYHLKLQTTNPSTDFGKATSLGTHRACLSDGVLVPLAGGLAQGAGPDNLGAGTGIV